MTIVAQCYLAWDLGPVVALTGGFPVAATTHIYVGSLVAVNGSGYVVPASADSSLAVIGVAEEEKDNSGGSAGACPGSIVGDEVIDSSTATPSTVPETRKV